MARPRKTGLDYFPFDVDFFSNKKIKILRARYGADGVAIYIFLLCEIYRNGYYIVWDNDYKYVISDELNLSDGLIEQVLTFLVERSLLNSILLDSDTILTSPGIQKRYQEAVKKRVSKSTEKIPVDDRLWLLKKDETQSFICNTQNQSLSEKNPNKSENNDSFSYEKPHKVKQSKVKQSKVNKSKVKQSSTDGELLDDILLSFNSACISLDPVKSRSDYSKRMLLQLTAQKNDLDFEKLFERVERSDFLTGRNGRWSKGGNKASFEWIIRPDNANKILSGRYDNKEPAKYTEDDGGSYDDPF